MTDQTPTIVQCGTNGMLSCVRKLSTITTAKAVASWASRVCVTSGRNVCGRRYTRSAPAVMPNIATEIATKAKWYHIVTLKIRVSAISYISVESVTKKSPA